MCWSSAPVPRASPRRAGCWRWPGGAGAGGRRPARRPGLDRSRTLGAPFDLGASRMHVAERNPVAPIARELGSGWATSGGGESDILLFEGRPANAAEHAAHDAAWEAGKPPSRPAPASRPDIALAEAVPRDGPWDATISHWFGSVISGVVAERFSLRDFVATGLAAPTCWSPGGSARWSRRWGKGCRLPSARGDHCAGAARSVAAGGLGVAAGRGGDLHRLDRLLAARGIRFDPACRTTSRRRSPGCRGRLIKVALRRPARSASASVPSRGWGAGRRAGQCADVLDALALGPRPCGGLHRRRDGLGPGAGRPGGGRGLRPYRPRPLFRLGRGGTRLRARRGGDRLGGGSVASSAPTAMRGSGSMARAPRCAMRRWRQAGCASPARPATPAPPAPSAAPGRAASAPRGGDRRHARADRGRA